MPAELASPLATAHDDSRLMAGESGVFPTGDFISDEPPLESSLHLQQMLLLISCLEWLWQDRNDYFIAGNLTVYYSDRQLKSEKFRGPDFFVVLGTEKKPRNSWVVWQEGGKYPNLIVELLSDSTANTDRETKKAIYQDAFRTPEYFWFDPKTLEFAGFELVDSQYVPIEPTVEGRLWSKQLQLFLGIQDEQLRYFLPDGALVPTPEESAKLAQAKMEVAEQEAAIAKAKAEQLAQKLRELGVDPDSLSPETQQC